MHTMLCKPLNPVCGLAHVYACKRVTIHPVSEGRPKINENQKYIL